MTLQRAVLYPLVLLLLNAGLGFGQPTIKLIAGGNGLAPIGDGGPAIGAFIGQAGNITVDAAGNLYIWDATDSRVRKVNTAGIISSVTATVGQLKEIEGTGGLATDSAGNLYIGDRQSYVVRKVDTSGVMTTIAGNGTAGFSGTNNNGSQATTVPICSPSGVVADRTGNVYFGSSICGTIRRVDTSGVLSTLAGGGSPSFSQTPWALAMDNSGNLYACDDGVGTRVYKVTPSGAITVIAGNGTSGFSGDGGPPMRNCSKRTR
jgi:sugar lactone lactonase YvrE